MSLGVIDVGSFVPLALKLARAHWRRRRRFQLDDYRQEACLALVIAAQRFDATRGILFTTFAHVRIVGALIDADRRWSDYSRHGYGAPEFLNLMPTDHVTDSHEASVLAALDLELLIARLPRPALQLAARTLIDDHETPQWSTSYRYTMRSLALSELRHIGRSSTVQQKQP